MFPHLVSGFYIRPSVGGVAQILCWGFSQGEDGSLALQFCDTVLSIFSLGGAFSFPIEDSIDMGAAWVV